MIKSLIFAVIGSMIWSTSVTAQVVAPNDVIFNVVSLGHIDEKNIVPMTEKNGLTKLVKMTSCNENWADRDLFYLIYYPPNNTYLVKKQRLDQYWKDTDSNWDQSIQLARLNGNLCIV